LRSTTVLPSGRAVIPTASQPRAPSSLRAWAAAEAPGAWVAGSKLGSSRIKYSQLVMSPSWLVLALSVKGPAPEGPALDRKRPGQR